MWSSAVGLLSHSQVQDPRIEPGAYIRDGCTLYRVVDRAPTLVNLEDVYRSNAEEWRTVPVTVSEVLAGYVLVRAAATEYRL